MMKLYVRKQNNTVDIFDFEDISYEYIDHMYENDEHGCLSEINDFVIHNYLRLNLYNIIYINDKYLEYDNNIILLLYGDYDTCHNITYVYNTDNLDHSTIILM